MYGVVVVPTECLNWVGKKNLNFEIGALSALQSEKNSYCIQKKNTYSYITYTCIYVHKKGGSLEILLKKIEQF